MQHRSRPSVIRLLALAGCLIAGALAASGPASAAPPDDSWTCRSQALDVHSGPLGLALDPLLDPIEGLITAGGDDAACAPSGGSPLGGFLNQITTALAPLGIDLGAVTDTTSIDTTKVPRLQQPQAFAEVADLDIDLAGFEVLDVDAVEATATASCSAGVAQYSSSFDVGQVRLFGAPFELDLDEPVTTISNGLAPLNTIVELRPGHEEKTADGATRTGLRVRVLQGLPGAEVQVLDVSLAVAKVADAGNPCVLPVPPTVGVPELTDGRSIAADVAPPAGRGIASCSFALTPTGGGAAVVVAGTYAGGRCTATLPESRLPAGSYSATATATTDAADPGRATGGAATLPVGLPDVGAATVDGRTVSAPVTTAAGRTITACRVTVVPVAGGAAVELPGTIADGRCRATLPRGQFPPGQYDVTIAVTDSTGFTGSQTTRVTIAGPTIGDPVPLGPLVVLPVAPGPGATLVECSAVVTPVAGGASKTVAGVLDPGTSSCSLVLPPAEFPPGEYDIATTIRDSYGDTASRTSRVPVIDLAALAGGGAGTGNAGTGGGSGSGSGGSSGPKTTAQVAADRLACESRKVALLDVARSGKRVRVSGVAATDLVGRTVRIRVAGKGLRTRSIGSAKVRKDGRFSTTVPTPAKRYLTKSAAVRYSAAVGSATSRSLRLLRRTTITSATVSGKRIRLRGAISAPYPKAGQVVRIRRQVGCSTYRTVAKAKTTRSGRFTASFATPKDGSAAFYRVETKVPSRKGGPARSGSFSLPRLVAGR